MKKLLSTLLALSLALSLGACAVKVEPGEPDEPAKDELRVVFTEEHLTKEVEYKADDGTVLLIEKYDLPQLEVRTSANEVYTPPVSNTAVDVPQEYAAALAFNAEMQRAADALDASAQEALAMAREHYAGLDEEQRAYWTNYAEELIVDDICQFSGLVSVWGGGYSNYGGAHGWESIRAWSFDLTTGEFLTLDGLDAQPSTDSALGESLTHTLAMAVLEQIDAQGLSEYYFEDYASYIFDLAANASFYFNDKGMTIVFDPAVIAPYAASAQKFEIPYSRFYNALDSHTQSLLNVPQDEIIIADYYTTKTLWSWFNMTTPPVDSGARCCASTSARSLPTNGSPQAALWSPTARSTRRGPTAAATSPSTPRAIWSRGTAMPARSCRPSPVGNGMTKPAILCLFPEARLIMATPLPR